MPSQIGISICADDEISPRVPEPLSPESRLLAECSAVVARHTNAYSPTSLHVQPFHKFVHTCVLWRLLTPARSVPAPQAPGAAINTGFLREPTRVH